MSKTPMLDKILSKSKVQASAGTGAEQLEALAAWLKETGFPLSKMEITFLIEGKENDYAGTCNINSGGSYAGLILQTKPGVGDHTRYNDLPDGDFNAQTFQRITKELKHYE